MWLGLLALFIASFFGGAITPILVKLGVKEIPPLTFSAMRFFLATIFFTPFFFTQKIDNLNRRNIFTLFLASIPFTLNIAFFSVGIQFTTAVMSQIFYASGSLIVAILAYLFFKDQLNRYKIAGLILALFGVVFLIERSAATQQTLTFGTPLGNILILCAVFSYASYLVISQKMTKMYTPQTTSFFSFVTSAIILAIVSPIELLIRPVTFESVTMIGIYSLLGVALFSSALYFFLVQFGIKRTDAFTASLFHYTAPFFAAIAAAPILGEKSTVSLAFGGFLIILGVFLATTYEQVRKYLKSVLQ